MRLHPARPERGRLGAFGAAAIALLLPACATGAQAIRLELVSELEQLPVRGAVVTVFAGEGAVAEGLTTVLGTRRFELPGPGAYRIRIRRVGFAPYITDAISIASDETRELRLVVPSRRVELPPVVVATSGKGCSRGDQRSVAAAALWEQVSAALAASEISLADSLVETRVHKFRRRLDRDGQRLEGETSATAAGGARPFFAIDPGRLSRRGYIVVDDTGSFVYYAPDARVLLSPEFEAGHCFTAVAGREARAGLVGLAFEPVRGRRLPDIRGTLWLEPASAELTLLEFEYVNVRWPQPARRAGGHVAFVRLPSGAWMVRDWSIRMPRFNEPLPGRRRRVLLGYTEEGGVARSVAECGVPSADATAAERSDPAVAAAGTANCDSSVLRRDVP